MQFAIFLLRSPLTELFSSDTRTRYMKETSIARCSKSPTGWRSGQVGGFGTLQVGDLLCGLATIAVGQGATKASQ